MRFTVSSLACTAALVASVAACSGSVSENVKNHESPDAQAAEKDAQSDAPGCEPGTSRCLNGAVENCSTTGQWLPGSECKHQSCVAGTCQGDCAPADKQCNGNTPQSCDPVGHWKDAAACIHQTCVDGKCQGVCAPGECDGIGPSTCDPTGHWQTGGSCPHQTCISGWCTGECAPGELHCNGATAEACDASGSWEFLQNCVGSTPACCKAACEAATQQAALGGFHTCAVKTDGTLWCWGQNDSGQLGDGTNIESAVPKQVGSLGSSVAAVVASGAHTCALKNDGTVWCWGANDQGQLGDGTADSHNVPVQVSALGTSVVQVATGTFYSHTCARKNDGTVWCWGHGTYGQLGDGTSTSQPLPVKVIGLGGSAIMISAGYAHTCAIRADGTLWCWGYDGNGQVGNGKIEYIYQIPQHVKALGKSVVAVSAGRAHTCAVKDDATLWCWGSNHTWQLGNELDSSSSCWDYESCVPGPAQVEALGAGVVEVSAGAEHTCARKSDGSLWCWGQNADGQLGNGTIDGAIPTATANPTPGHVTALGMSTTGVAVSWRHTCAIKTDGTLWCWGRSGHGQLGDGTTAGQGCRLGKGVCKPNPVQSLLVCP